MGGISGTTIPMNPFVTPSTVTDAPFVLFKVATLPPRYVSAGARHTCVLLLATAATALPRALCFGDNSSGQLGTGNYSPAGGPPQGAVVPRAMATVDFFAGLYVHDIAAGERHTCMVTSSDTVLGNPRGVKCFGDNTNGQVGVAIGGATEPTPLDVRA